MSTIRRFFETIKRSRFERYCSCGHMVSVNLPYCPHCGKTIR